jgi:hypothetical protein
LFSGLPSEVSLPSLRMNESFAVFTDTFRLGSSWSYKADHSTING